MGQIMPASLPNPYVAGNVMLRPPHAVAAIINMNFKAMYVLVEATHQS